MKVWLMMPSVIEVVHQDDDTVEIEMTGIEKCSSQFVMNAVITFVMPRPPRGTLHLHRLRPPKQLPPSPSLPADRARLHSSIREYASHTCRPPSLQDQIACSPQPIVEF